jgi:hypothetical protein
MHQGAMRGVLFSACVPTSHKWVKVTRHSDTFFLSALCFGGICVYIYITNHLSLVFSILAGVSISLCGTFRMLPDVLSKVTWTQMAFLLPKGTD